MLVLALALSCSGGGGMEVEVVDGPAHDAIALDAALPDAPPDATLPDAPPDAPLDGPVDSTPPDGPVDGTPPDATPPDGPTPDAVVDAAPVLDTLGFPAPSPVPLVIEASGALMSATPGETQVAWVDMDTTLWGSPSWRAYLDGEVATLLGQTYPSAVRVQPGEAGHARVVVPAALSLPEVGVSDVAVGTGAQSRWLAVEHVVDVVDATAAGTVVIVSDGASTALRRIDASFALDATFGGAGWVPLPGPVGPHVTQAIGASTVITLVAADRLLRIDATTGARVVSFGGTGDVTLDLAPTATLLALAPLPGGAVALVVRPAPAATSVELVRVDATGARALAVSVDLPLPAVAAGADASGRVVVAFDLVGDTQRLMRLDASTGQVDLGFGVAGKAHAAAPVAPPPVDYTLTDRGLRFIGVQGDGRIVLSKNFTYAPPGSCAGLPVTCELPYARVYRLD